MQNKARYKTTRGRGVPEKPHERKQQMAKVRKPQILPRGIGNKTRDIKPQLQPATRHLSSSIIAPITSNSTPLKVPHSNNYKQLNTSQASLEPQLQATQHFSSSLIATITSNSTPLKLPHSHNYKQLKIFQASS